MSNLRIAAVLLTAGIWTETALAFSSDGSSIIRSFSAELALTNSPVIVTVTFTNGQTNTLRGWFYSDQLPAGLSVNTLSVKIDGHSVPNYVVESGQVSEVYPGCKPWRWVLEQPPAFNESNVIAGSGTIELMYAVNALSPGSFALQQYSWCAWAVTTTNACFGHSESVDQQTVDYVDAPPPPDLVFSYTGDGFELSLDGVSGVTYVLEASTNLVEWVSLATNTTSSSLVDTNTAFLERFYRALWRP